MNISRSKRFMSAGWNRRPLPSFARGIEGFFDFAASRKANEVYARFIQQVAIEGIAKPIRFYPEGVAASMIKNDLVWASENRERIVAEWARRYGRK